MCLRHTTTDEMACVGDASGDPALSFQRNHHAPTWGAPPSLKMGYPRDGIGHHPNVHARLSAMSLQRHLTGDARRYHRLSHPTSGKHVGEVLSSVASR